MAYSNIKLMYADALLSLCNEKPLRKITVLDIIRRAQTSKQTFYNHFRDKYDLINFIYEHNAIRMANKNLHYNTWIESKKEVLDFCLKHKKFFSNAVSMDDINCFPNFYYDHLKKFNTDYIKKNFKKSKLTDDLIFAIDFYSSGASGILVKWIKNGMEEPTESVAESIYQCIPNELKTYLEKWSGDNH